MSTDDLEKKPTQTGNLRRLSKSGILPKPGTQNLIEQTPAWLKRLLTKYGEREGRLAGLGEGSVEAEEFIAPTPAKGGTTGALSNLLEQMAEEGPAQYSQEQRATSVEWGSYDEPEAPPLDDFLAGLGSDQPNYQAAPPADAPDWITNIIPDTAPAEPAYDNEAPDWLAEMMLPGVSPPSQAPSTRIEEAPDWLSEALGTPAGSTPPPATASPGPVPAGSTDVDVPDWLTEALDTPAAAPPPPPAAPRPATPTSGFDVPDWLAEPSEPDPPELTPAASPAAETPYDVDVPDWLTGIVTPPGPEAADAGESDTEVDVPDWLADIASPVVDDLSASALPEISARDTPDWVTVETPSAEPETSTWDTPDWLADTTSPLETPAAEVETSTWDTPDWMTKPTSPVADETPAPAPDGITTDSKTEPTLPDTPAVSPGPTSSESWFAQGSDLPSLDWLFNEAPVAQTPDQSETRAPERADWLFEPLQPLPSATPQPAQKESAWLKDPAELEPDSDDVPDWLAQTETLAETPLSDLDQPPAWLDNFQTGDESGADTPQSLSGRDDDWLAGLDVPAEAPIALADDWLTEVEDEAPSWLTPTETLPPTPSLPEPPSAAEASTLKSLKPLKRLSPQPSAPTEPPTSAPLPDWAAGLVPADAPTGQSSPALPDWAAGLVPPGAASGEAASPALPDWAKTLAPPDTETKAAPPTQESPASAAPRPLQRLGGLSKPSPAQPPTEAPDWMNDSSVSANEPSDWLAESSQLTAETPDWLNELSAPSAESSQPAADTSDWLNNLSASPVEPFQTPVETSDWMSKLSASMGETPDWISNVPPGGAAEVPDGMAGLDQPTVEPSDWMAELSQFTQDSTEFSTETDFTPEILAAEEDDDLLASRLDWFTQSNPTEISIPAPELNLPPVSLSSSSPAAEEPESLDWLTDWPTQSATAETTATATQLPNDSDIPAWLTDMPEVSAAEKATPPVMDQPETTPDDLSWLFTVPEITSPGQAEAPVNLETPSWLTEPPESTASSPSSDEAELETPPWLTNQPDSNLERSTWLAEMPETPVAGQTFEPDEEDDLATPNWLIDLLETADSDTSLPQPVEPATAEVREETPPWLASWPAAEAPESVVEEVGEELEIPAWMTGLSAATEPELPAPTWGEESEDEVELETLPWLTNLAETSEVEVNEAASETETPLWSYGAEELTAEDDLPGEATEPASEIPSWLNELPETSGELDVTASEIPSWLAGLREITEEEPSSVGLAEAIETEVEPDLPNWLMDLPESPANEVEPEVETEPEAELEMPAWLSGLPEAPTEVVEPVAEIEPEAELEMPSWLSGLAEAPAAEVEPVAEPEAELEIPSWLSELPEAPTEVVEPVAEIEPEAELEIPSWLSELPEAPTEVVEPVAEIEPEAELEMPSWLSGLAEAPVAEVEPVAEAEPEAEVEMPSWLSELPESPTEVVEPEAELEMPSWLSGLQETSTIEAVESVAEAEPEAELEMPSWLSGLQETSTVEADPIAETEFEIPSWLNESLEASESQELSAAPPEDGEMEEELEISSWLTGVMGATAAGVAITALDPTETQAEETPPVVEAALIEEAEADISSWLGEAPKVAEAETPPGESLAEVETEPPSWLDDLSTEDLKLPSWLSDVPETEAEAVSEQNIPVEADVPAAAEIEEELPPESEWLVGLGAATAAVQAVLPEEKADQTFLAVEAEPELPDWMLDSPENTEVVNEPAAPDWLADLSDTTPPLPSAMPRPPLESKASPSERMSDWLRGLQPIEEPLADEDDKVAEATGVLAGLGPLLPMEKIAMPTPLLEPQATASTAQAEAMQAAAHHFYTIATQAPQPATLPEPLTRRENLPGKVMRGVLFLLFIILVALPLIPGCQKIDSASGQGVPWTEPAGALNEVLDEQRRELISVQLGVIDLQQPDSVALISMDYSAATQGEMQPLAEAIIGRLRGQGMRLIFISLEPEGATLAQQTIDKILAERGEIYGAEVVNLGYVPGQIAGIREVVTGRKQLAAQSDFKEGLTFAAPERVGWSDINNLGQVDVVITLSDNPATARWWIEQMAAAMPPDDGERYLLAATSATADPFVRPYLDSFQLDGLISGINGAAAIEAGRKNFGPARQMLDSQGIAHLLIVILIALGTMVGWMPATEKKARVEAEAEAETEADDN